jgi:hypothetical protein
MPVPLSTFHKPMRPTQAERTCQQPWAAQLGSVDEVLMTLARLFRCATTYSRGRGVGCDDERGGTLLQEEPVIVFSYVAEADLTTNTRSELYRTLSRLGRRPNQSEIGVVIDGKYYGITEYVEEEPMLLEKEIQQALHANRIIPLAVARPHGPLGLEQLAAAVSRDNPALGSGFPRVRRPIALDHETWEKLEQLAETATQTTLQHVTASQVAVAIIEQYVAALPQRGNAQE